MRISIETKYNVNDTLWTRGWKFADKGAEAHPVQVKVTAVTVCYKEDPSPQTVINYFVFPVNDFEDTLDWDYEKRCPRDTNFPVRIWEYELFPTEAEYLEAHNPENELPF